MKSSSQAINIQKFLNAFHTFRYGTVRYGTVRYGTVRYGTVRYGTVRYGTVRYGTVRLKWKTGLIVSLTRGVSSKGLKILVYPQLVYLSNK